MSDQIDPTILAKELREGGMSQESIDLSHDLLATMIEYIRDNRDRIDPIKVSLDVPIHMIEHVMNAAPSSAHKVATFLYVLEILADMAGFTHSVEGHEERVTH